MSHNIMVTGASGAFGKNSIEFLLEKGVKPKNIFALVRNESKIDQQLKEKGISIRTGDYNNFESLVNAFEGIDKLLFVSSPDIPNRSLQHSNVINAAIKCGSVKFIAFTSFTRKHNSFEIETPVDYLKKTYIETEQLLQQSNIQYTSLQNGLYADTLIQYFFGPKVLETGIFFPAGDGKTNFATRRDLAEAAVNVILNNDQYLGTTSLKFTSDESSSFHDISKILTDATGKQIQYTSPPISVYKSVLLGSGVPEQLVGFSIAFANAIESSEFTSDHSDLSKVLNRQPTTLKQFLTQHYKSNKNK